MQEFVLESAAGLESVEQDLLQLERTSDPAVIGRVFRILHSMKGSSSFLELRQLERLTHQAETLLDLLRQQKRAMTPAVIDALLAANDLLKQMLRMPDFGGSLQIDGMLNRLGAEIGPPQPNMLRTLTGSSFGDSPPPGQAVSVLLDSAQMPLGQTMMMTPEIATDPELAAVRSALQAPPDQDSGMLSESAFASFGAPPASFNPPPAVPPPVAAPTLERPMPAATVGAATSHFAPAAPPSLATVAGSAAPQPPAATNEVPSAAATVKPESDSPEDKLMRVRVRFLDELLELTGNMVMARNQLLSKYHFGDDPSFLTLSQCVTRVHEAIVQTRMQPIGTLFDRCERLARDLARQLGKEVQLTVQGRDLELDRSVLEAFADPLTHLLRNALDHGLETPELRLATGKPRQGEVKLGARQQGAEIILELEDDGRGIDPTLVGEKAVARGLVTADRLPLMSRREIIDLIFQPGFSTRDEVSALSGRGVGLDVVRTNLKALGGVVDAQSRLGQGSLFTARMPLTQALVSSSLISALVVTHEGERYAIPRTGVDEIIKINTIGERDRLHLLNGRMVYQLRDIVLPVIPLQSVLHGRPPRPEDIVAADRILIVLEFRNQLFGVLVQGILGVEEIVVRPLPELVRQCTIFSGHTVMGDGRVALILNSSGMIDQQRLVFADEAGVGQLRAAAAELVAAEQRLVVFSYADTERFAIPLEMVSLIEKIPLDSIRRVGPHEYVQVMQRTLPLMRLDKVMGVSGLPALKEAYVLIPARVSYPIAVLAGRHVNVIDASRRYESQLSDNQGILGTFMHQEQLIMLLDLYRLFERHSPERFQPSAIDQRPAHILVAEDSPFFQSLIRSYLDTPPRQLTVVGDGQAALELLQARPYDFDVVVSDIEMPWMTGFELVQKIRADAQLRTLPVIAVTSLSSTEHVERGLREGFDSYLIKMDKEQLVRTIDRHLESGARRRGVALSGKAGG